MKVIEFPKEQDRHDDLIEFIDEVKETIKDRGVTQAVVVMMDDERQIGMSMAGNYIDITAMLGIAFKEL